MSGPFKKPRIGELLVSKGWARQQDVDSGLAQASGALLGQWLLSRGMVTAVNLSRALAEQFELAYADLDGFSVEAGLFQSIPAGLAYRHKLLPYRLHQGRLQVVLSDPFDLKLKPELEEACGGPVECLLSHPQAVEAALQRSQAGMALLKDLSQRFKPGTAPEAGARGPAEALSLRAAAGDETGSMVTLVNTILLAALEERASDVHLEAYDRGTLIRYRVDGILYPATHALDAGHHQALVGRIKVMAGLDLAENRLPQDGRFELKLQDRALDFRVSILPSVHGEDVVIRVLDKAGLTQGLESLRLDRLGLAPEVLAGFRRAVRAPYGMVLMTGPTGSGKTTTLYAALSELDVRGEKVITIEDPVEYQLEGVVQVPVNEKKQLTFARGLRSVLRHDPDKIMVGEIRDAETAQIAVQSALTGHLVFTTVHANSACDVIGRFSHMGINLYSFVSALHCVMAQRLVRLICPKCKREAKADADLLRASGLDPAGHAGRTWHEGAGCDHCAGSGYRGRKAVAELMPLSPLLRSMILEQKPVDELQAAACREGMQTLRQAAVAAALAGETTLKEINRVTLVA